MKQWIEITFGAHGPRCVYLEFFDMKMFANCQYRLSLWPKAILLIPRCDLQQPLAHVSVQHQQTFKLKPIDP